MTPAQPQERSTSRAGDMQGKPGGTEPALCQHPELTQTQRGKQQAAFAAWGPLGEARAAWEGQGSAPGCGERARPPLGSPWAQLPRQSWPGPPWKAQPVHEEESSSPMKHRASLPWNRELLCVWRLRKHSKVSQVPTQPAQTGHSPPGPPTPLPQPVALGRLA